MNFGNINSIENGKSWGINRLGINKLWEFGYKGQGVTVAILDTFVDKAHRGFGGRVLDNIDCKLPTAIQTGFHGSSVAGVIGAGEVNNVSVGVAPECKIISYELFGMNKHGVITAGIKEILNALQNAIDRNVDIINISWGLNTSKLVKKDKDSVEKLIAEAKEKNIIVICAAGNHGHEDTTESNIDFPAFLKNVIAVGGLRDDDAVDPVSAGGKELDIVAPSQKIASLGPDNDIIEDYGGTSYAAPFVSGVAALYLSMKRSTIPQYRIDPRVFNLLLKYKATDMLERRRDPQTGYGIINPQKLFDFHDIDSKYFDRTNHAEEEIQALEKHLGVTVNLL